MKTFKIGENTFEIAETVIKDMKASENMGLLKCIQCGICTSVCPAARQTDYDPRELVKRVLDNDETLINDDILWDCFYCYTCHSMCPVNNSPCEINQILKQKAIDNGKGKPKIAPFTEYADSYLQIGLGTIPDYFLEDLIEDYGKEWYILKNKVENIRKELELDTMELPEKDVEDINNILQKTGFKKRLERIKRCNNEEHTR